MAFLNLGTGFWAEFVAAAARLQVNPVHLAQVIYCESGWDPNVPTNPMTPTAGLNQCVGPTLRRLGFGTENDVPICNRFRQLTGLEQLPWVEKYFRPYAGRMKSAPMVYVVNFEPGYFGAVEEARKKGTDYVFGSKGSAGWLGVVYTYNTGLDGDHDLRITYQDLEAYLNQACAGTKWNQVLTAITDVTGEPKSLYPGGLGQIPWREPRYIKELQIGLNTLWYGEYDQVLSRAYTAPGLRLPLKTDGLLGDQTKAAVRAFQGQESLVIDGLPGPATRSKLAAKLLELKKLSPIS